MFGYINVLKDELKIKEFNIFKAYYCGLCKALGKRFNQLTRFNLSYDITFLAILLSSIDESEECIDQKPCIAHPFHKRRYVKDSDVVDYCADMSIILTYYKLLDDIKDDKSFKAMVAILPFYFSYRKIRCVYPSAGKISKQLKLLAKLEKEKCGDIDRIADTFGMIMQALFDFKELSQNNHKIFSWMGYNIGRWIYIIDACNDYEYDVKNKKYNVLKYSNADKTIIEDALTYTLNNVARSYELLTITKNKGILDNIIYKGLIAKQTDVLQKLKKVIL